MSYYIIYISYSISIILYIISFIYILYILKYYIIIYIYTYWVHYSKATSGYVHVCCLCPRASPERICYPHSRIYNNHFRHQTIIIIIIITTIIIIIIIRIHHHHAVVACHCRRCRSKISISRLPSARNCSASSLRVAFEDAENSVLGE